MSLENLLGQLRAEEILANYTNALEEIEHRILDAQNAVAAWTLEITHLTTGKENLKATQARLLAAAERGDVPTAN